MAFFGHEVFFIVYDLSYETRKLKCAKKQGPFVSDIKEGRSGSCKMIGGMVLGFIRICGVAKVFNLLEG